MLTQQLEEFQYKVGDPRPYFFNYLKTFPKFTTYIKKRINIKNSFVFTCNPESKRRSFKIPDEKIISKILDHIKNNNITIIPTFIIKKLGCKHKNQSRHMNILLYNKITNEVERLDIRKYHLTGYSLKLFYKSLHKKVSKTIDPNIKHIIEIDVPDQFIKKHNFDTIQNAYPTFLLAYLTMRSKYPELKSENIIKQVLKLNNVKSIWDKYVDYLKTNTKMKCSDNLIQNPESGSCLQFKSMNKYAINKQPKECPDKKLYNSLLDKCVTKLSDVDILLDDIFANPIKKEKELLNLDSSAKLSIGLVNFIMTKYPYAKFLIPKVTKSEKKLRVLKWTFNKETNDFKLKYPSDYWDLWKDAQSDPQIRFIISLLSLVSSLNGHHANVLIYDKDSNEIERFDGIGRDLDASYNIDEFDKLMQQELKQQFQKPPKYFAPLNYCPKFAVFQSKEIDDIPGIDLRGNCAVWRMWYINIRLANPHLNRKTLVLLAAKKLEQTGSLYKFIKSYQRYILESVKKKRK
jgi:hypothetical protein